MMWWWSNGPEGWGWLGMGALMIIFWGLVIFGIVMLVRYLGAAETSHPTRVEHGARPEDILADRFAKGEIDVEEYLRCLEILHGGTGPSSTSRQDSERERDVESRTR